MSQRLLTVDEFREAKRARGQLIVITDAATGHRIHHAWCGEVREASFVRTVIDGGGTDGAYYSCSSPAEAEALGAVACPGCHSPAR